MASFYPTRKREGPLTLEAVASSLRAGAAKQESVARKLAAPASPAKIAHRALIAKENTAEDVLRIASDLGDEIDANNVSTAIHKVAQCCRRDGGVRVSATLRNDARFSDLARRGSSCSDSWTPRQLCHVAWSMAVLHADRRGKLLTSVIDNFTKKGPAEGVPQDLSTVAWALAILLFKDASVLDRMAAASSERLSEFVPQDLAISGWAFAKLLYEGRRPLLEQISKATKTSLPSFSGRNLANVAWTFATTAQRDLGLCEALAGAVLGRMNDLGAQELPITLWSFAAMPYPCDEVFRAASSQVMRSFHGMDVSHICNVAWAFARGGPRDEPLFERIAEEAMRRLDVMETLHVSNLAWAFASLARADEFDTARVGFRHEPLMIALSNIAATHVQDLLPQHTSSMVWAVAAVLVDSGNHLCDSIASNMRRGGGSEYTPRHTSTMLWALAVQPRFHEPLCAMLLTGITGGGINDLASDGPAHLASIAWAAARLQCSSHAGFRLALRSDVDGLVSSLAGGGGTAEISEGRQQNVAAVVRTLYDMGLADTARAFFIRVMDAGVPVGGEAWSAWLCGSACVADAELEHHLWFALANSHDGLMQRSAALQAAAIRALAAGRSDLAKAALDARGSDGHGVDERRTSATPPVTAHLLRRVSGGGGGSTAAPEVFVPTAACSASSELPSPRGEYRHELKMTRRLVYGAAQGDAAALVEIADAVSSAEARELLPFAAGPGGACLDNALDLALASARSSSAEKENGALGIGGVSVVPLLVVEIGCGLGCAAVRAACRLRDGLTGVNVVAIEADPVRAALALSIVEWAGLSGHIEVIVGRAEQVLPHLRRSHGAGCVGLLVLNSQGSEYHEELARAYSLGILAEGAVLLADCVLQPLAPEFMWHIFNSSLYSPAAVVPIDDNWVLLSQRRHSQHAVVPSTWADGGSNTACWKQPLSGPPPLDPSSWPASPPSVRQLRHRADEARRRTVAWRRRDRLAFFPPPPRLVEAEQAQASYAGVSIRPTQLWPSRLSGGRWRVDLNSVLSETAHDSIVSCGLKI
eukprot:TRINITY_DN33463_c0_g1_i1.p1 TRINITY_DN33463_c0_g1~~TRINITY_DN33463_c0_g1_i1.p1  ORF type:complete len:1044 (-),score=155.17 TRINITY_DN33463_c0_g1_i1:55-3186(-)